MMTVGRDTIVSIRFNMYDETGQLLEAGLESPPVRYLHGGDKIMDALQHQLSGLSAGDSRRVVLTGSENPLQRLIFFDVVIDSVRAATSAEKEEGQPLPGHFDDGSQLVIHLVSGFLGSGKTTAIYQACKQVPKKGQETVVITNDQGRLLVDTHFFGSKGIRVLQVSDGCYCCNYNTLEGMIAYLSHKVSARSKVFAEAVGSCTDMVATVMKPLLNRLPAAIVTVTTFVDASLLSKLIRGKMIFSDDVRYIFLRQLEEASVIVLNKIDLLEENGLREVQQYLQLNYPGKEVLEQNSLIEKGTSPWVTWLEKQNASRWLPSLEIDYDRYATGEARMAWLDKELVIESIAGVANKVARELANDLADMIIAKGMPVGHLKFWINGAEKLSFTASGTNSPDLPAGPAAFRASLLINARVETEPEQLDEIVQAAIRKAGTGNDAQVTTTHAALFKPGYPVPIQRIA